MEHTGASKNLGAPPPPGAEVYYYNGLLLSWLLQPWGWALGNLNPSKASGSKYLPRITRQPQACAGLRRVGLQAEVLQLRPGPSLLPQLPRNELSSDILWNSISRNNGRKCGAFSTALQTGSPAYQRDKIYSVATNFQRLPFPKERPTGRSCPSTTSSESKVPLLRFKLVSQLTSTLAPATGSVRTVATGEPAGYRGSRDKGTADPQTTK